MLIDMRPTRAILRYTYPRPRGGRHSGPPRAGAYLLVEQALVALGVKQALDRLGHEAPADPRIALVACEVDRRERQRLAVGARLVGDPREDAALADRRLAAADLLHNLLRRSLRRRLRRSLLHDLLRRRRRLLRHRLLRRRLLRRRLRRLRRLLRRRTRHHGGIS